MAKSKSKWLRKREANPYMLSEKTIVNYNNKE